MCDDINSTIQYHIGHTSLPPTVESSENNFHWPMSHQMSMPDTIESSKHGNNMSHPSQSMPATPQPIAGMRN